MTVPGRTLLTYWMLLAVTGTVVDHRHAGAPGHTHGFGWAALHGPCHCSDLPIAHRHLVLLGVEFDATPLESDEGDFSGSHVGPLVGVFAPATDAGAESLPDLLTNVILAPVETPFLSSMAKSCPTGAPCPSLRYCPSACQALSGVLRS